MQGSTQLAVYEYAPWSATWMAGARPAIRFRGLLFEHDLFGKPVPIPDQVEDMLFGIVL
jgi:hypothetical protein